MATAATPITAEAFRRLHPQAIDDPARIRSLLERLWREGTPLTRSTDRFSRRETARIVEIGEGSLVLEVRHFESRTGRQIFLNFEIDGRPFFFATPLDNLPDSQHMHLSWPAVIYQAERRDRVRCPVASGRVALGTRGRALAEAELVDTSPDGLGLRVPDRVRLQPGATVDVNFLEGEKAGRRVFGRVCNSAPGDEGGWKRIGLSVSNHRGGEPLPVERRDVILPASQKPFPPRTSSEPGEGPAHSDELRVIDYWNERGERLRGLVDGFGPSRGSPAVIIPPAWGRTKETLLPLAATIVATFRKAGEPVTVLRFDGVRKRGESHTAPECREPGAEYSKFTFSQGMRDIHATLEHLASDPDFAPHATALVTFSVASIEGRRAVATARAGRLGGWVSVVGSADAQSLTRVISGGVDFFGGIERGLRFGNQELQGLLVDMDLAGRDAIENKMAFLEDARRDFARIDVPVTWIHGRDDAWMDLARIREVMAFGDQSRRRLIEVPTGHQLRTSEEALATFQLIAVEVGRMLLGREIEPALPDLAWLAERRDAERARLRTAQVDLQQFWQNYLVGRDGTLGMELVTNTHPYHDLMKLQVAALNLDTMDRVLDLGSGVGSFPSFLQGAGSAPSGLTIVEADYVRAGLKRARRLTGRRSSGPRTAFVACNLDLQSGRPYVPVGDCRFDAVLASLLLNYVKDPDALLREAYRVLRPGGRLVLSSLKRDADTSTICVDTVSELRSGRGREVFGGEGERQMDRALRNFINDAAKLLDYEEQGLFHFWSAAELIAQACAAGFIGARVVPGFGRAPQAFVLSARRP